MAIVLPYTFAGGATRSGAEVNANLEVIRKWLNGKIEQADIVTDCVNYQHLVRPEHFGRPTITSQGVSCDVYGRRAADNKMERAVFDYEVGAGDYVTCPELAASITIERTSWVRVRARFHAWGFIHRSVPDVAVASWEIGTVGIARLYVNSTAQNSTVRRIMVHDGAVDIQEPMDRREHSLVWADTLVAGSYDLAVKIRTVESEYNTPLNPIADGGTTTFDSTLANFTICAYLFVQSRSFTIEVDPYFT